MPLSHRITSSGFGAKCSIESQRWSIQYRHEERDAANGDAFTVFGAFADASGFTQAGNVITPEEIKLIETVLAPINDAMIYVVDPDGTIIEVQQQW